MSSLSVSDHFATAASVPETGGGRWFRHCLQAVSVGAHLLPSRRGRVQRSNDAPHAIPASFDERHAHISQSMLRPVSAAPTGHWVSRCIKPVHDLITSTFKVAPALAIPSPCQASGEGEGEGERGSGGKLNRKAARMAVGPYVRPWIKSFWSKKDKNVDSKVVYGKAKEISPRAESNAEFYAYNQSCMERMKPHFSSFEKRLNRGSAKIHEDLDRFFEAEEKQFKAEFAASRLIDVVFRQLEKPDEDAFCLTLSKDYTYDQVVESIANTIRLNNPTRIQLTTHCTASQKPESKPIEYRGVSTLEHMFHWLCQRNGVLYYEVVEIPLPEMKNVENVEVEFHGLNNEVTMHSIQLWKDYSASYILNKLKSQVKLSNENAELRLLDVFYGCTYLIRKPDDLIDPADYERIIPRTLHAEEVPIEEQTESYYHGVVPVLQFTSSSRDKTANKLPLFLHFYEGDTLKDIKNRARKLLGVDRLEVARWKFEYLSASRRVVLKDTDILSFIFRKHITKALEQEFLAWEHSEFCLKIMYASRENKIINLDLITFIASHYLIII